jgi:hypothetical protein
VAQADRTLFQVQEEWKTLQVKEAQVDERLKKIEAERLEAS